MIEGKGVRHYHYGFIKDDQKESEHPSDLRGLIYLDRSWIR